MSIQEAPKVEAAEDDKQIVHLFKVGTATNFIEGGYFKRNYIWLYIVLIVVKLRGAQT